MQTHRVPRHALISTLACMALTVAALSGCTEDGLKPSYSKSDIDPVVTTRLSGSELRISFSNPLESRFHAAGMSYVVSGEEMRVTIDRCPTTGKCDTMIPREIVPGRPNPATQVIPLLAPSVFMVFSDGGEQIFP